MKTAKQLEQSLADRIEERKEWQIADKLTQALTERVIEPIDYEASRRKLDMNLACLRAIMRQPVSQDYLDGIALAIDLMEDVRKDMP